MNSEQQPFVTAIDGIQFDPARLAAACDEVVARANPVPAAGRADFAGSLSLTHKPGSAAPMEDGHQSQFRADGG